MTLETNLDTAFSKHLTSEGDEANSSPVDSRGLRLKGAKEDGQEVPKQKNNRKVQRDGPCCQDCGLGAYTTRLQGQDHS